MDINKKLMLRKLSKKKIRCEMCDKLPPPEYKGDNVYFYLDLYICPDCEQKYGKE